MGFWSSVGDFFTGGDDGGGLLSYIPIVGDIIDIFDGDDGNSAQEEANRIQQQEAQKNRDFQKEQTGTEVQRRVEDMKKAGINPLLSVTGASSGSGSGMPQTISTAKDKIAKLTAMTQLKGMLADAKLKTQMAQTEQTKQSLNSANTLSQLTTLPNKEATNLLGKNVVATAKQARGLYPNNKNIGSQAWDDLKLGAKLTAKQISSPDLSGFGNYVKNKFK